jgi:RNA polymerase sigma factor (sigma-70 family)
MLRQLRKLVASEEVADLCDEVLLERFIRSRDETAFEVLVRRHGSLVMGVCGRLLHNGADAEDACQATFLVLARSAASIDKRTSVGSWLYKVAYHVALRARRQMATRQRHERQAPAATGADPLAEVTGRELLTLLDEELQRLPGRYRTPLVHCYLQGQTRDEAARQMGCSQSTVNRRLEEGKKLLQERMLRRGLDLSAGLVALALTQKVAEAALSNSFRAATAKACTAAALGGATGNLLSPETTALANGALRAMSGAKLKLVASVLLAASLLVVSAGAMMGQIANRAGKQVHIAAESKEQSPAQDRLRQGAGAKDEKPMTLAGRVLDAAGKPLPEAQVALVGRPLWAGRSGDFAAEGPRLLAASKTGADGRFRLEATRTSSASFRHVFVLALAPNQGLGWLELNPDVEHPQVELRLPPEQILRGKFIDLQGQPAAGVSIRVSELGKTSPGEFKGPNFFGSPAKDLLAWPKPVTTDAQGQFVVRGIGQGAVGMLMVHDERFARQGFSFAADAKAGAKEFKGVVEPSKMIEGTVTYADTGKPALHARLTVYANNEGLGGGIGTDGRADANGRFRINPFPGSFFQVTAYAPDGAPYLTLRKIIKWPGAIVKQVVEMKLPSGVLLRGQVTEAGSGARVAGASVQYEPRRANNRPEGILTGWENMVVSGSDGRFDICVPSGPGHLLVHGPTTDYILFEMGSRQLSQGRPGGVRYYAHAFVSLELKPGAEPQGIAVPLKRGATVKGRVVGLDDKPVAEAMMLTRLQIDPYSPHWSGIPVQVLNGRFELHGLDPEKSYLVYFLDARNKLGATVELSGKQAGQDVKVRLLPCGSANIRILGPDGEPVPKLDVMLEIVVTPGPYGRDRKSIEQGKLAADAAFVVNIDRLNYGNGPPTDAQGRIAFPVLIPGATYRFVDVSDADSPVKKEFKAETGKKLYLGEVVLKEVRVK